MIDNDGSEFRWIPAGICCRWRLIAFSAIVAGGVMFGLSIWTPLDYEASTTLLVDLAKDQRTSDYTALVPGERLTLTYREMLKGRVVLEEVITQLGINSQAKQRIKIETKLTCLEKLVVGNQGDSQALQLIIQDLQLAEAQIAGYVKVVKLAQAGKDPGQTRYSATLTRRPISPRNVLRHFQLTLEKFGLAQSDLSLSKTPSRLIPPVVKHSPKGCPGAVRSFVNCLDLRRVQPYNSNTSKSSSRENKRHFLAHSRPWVIRWNQL